MTEAMTVANLQSHNLATSMSGFAKLAMAVSALAMQPLAASHQMVPVCSHSRPYSLGCAASSDSSDVLA